MKTKPRLRRFEPALIAVLFALALIALFSGYARADEVVPPDAVDPPLVCDEDMVCGPFIDEDGEEVFIIEDEDEDEDEVIDEPYYL